jgi:hypothetical protein
VFANAGLRNTLHSARWRKRSLTDSSTAM